MLVVFADQPGGRCWPDVPAGTDGAVGFAVIGLEGLVTHLETALGLRGPTPSSAVRIAAYLRKLREAQRHEPRFYSQSLSRDPWGSARLLLAWRDELVGGGWTPIPIGSAHLDALGSAETVGPELPAGTQDRVARLLGVLARRPKLQVEEIRVPGRLLHLQPVVRRLLSELAACSVKLEEEPAVPVGDPETDLGRVQRYLAGGTRGELVGDGSFVIVDARTALAAAEASADWLSCVVDETPDTLVLAPDGDTFLLDRALAARNASAAGLSSASRYRGALQVLPLALAVAWKPFDPRTLLDLLMLPKSPVAGFAASKLAEALEKEPGTGGPIWEAAWSDIEAKLVDDAGDAAGTELEKIPRTIARWRSWTAVGIHERSVGMPIRDAKEIASRVAAWAMASDAGDGDPLMMAAASHATAFAEAVEALGDEFVSANMLERILAEVIAAGVPDPGHVPESGPIRSVAAPGAIWSPVRNMLWWGFVGEATGNARAPWSREERRLLASAGVVLESDTEFARRRSEAEAAAVLRTSKRLVLVRPALSGSDVPTSHPLEHQLRPMTEAAVGLITFTAERLYDSPREALAGREIPRRTVEGCVPPAARPEWRLPGSVAEKLRDRAESATTLERMIDCQMRWLVLDVLKVRPGRARRISGPDQLIGNLAHAIAGRVLLPGPAPDANSALDAAKAVFDEVLDVVAAPLRLAEHAGELEQARRRVPEAVAELARLIGSKGYRIVGSEIDRRAHLGEGEVMGRTDILLEDGGGTPFVLDLKWTRSAKRYRTKVSDGRALQLATYRALFGTEKPAHAAYFLLRQREVVAEAGSPLTDLGLASTRTIAATWEAMCEAWGVWKSSAAEGTVLATGVPEGRARIPVDLMLQPIDEPCKYCEMTALCRVGGDR